MLPFQERKKIRKILYSKATLIVLLVTLVFVVRGAWNIYKKAAIARAERDQVAKDLADMEGRTAELRTSLERLRSNHGIEEEVRQKFTVAKPGEDIVVVVDENAKKGKNDEATEQGFWARFLGFFQGKL